MKNQYEPLVTPASWTGDQKRFAVRLTQILDELYAKYGALRRSSMRQDRELAGLIDSAANSPYPVGSVYFSAIEIDPAELWGGAWEQMSDVFQADLYVWKRVE